MTLVVALPAHSPLGANLLSYTLGIEVGLGAVRAVVIDEHGVILERSSETLPDAMEVETDLWFEALRAAIGRLSPARERVGLVGLAGQEGAFTFLDARDVELGPTCLGVDHRAEAEARELRHAFGEPVRSSHLAPRLLWWKRHRRAAFRAARHVLTVRGLLDYRLTGRLVAEPGDASTTGLFDGTRLKAAAGRVVDDSIPDLLAFRADSADLAAIDPDAADYLGLPREARVHAGGTDRLLAVRALSIVAPGPVMLRLGRGGCAVALHHEDAHDPDGWCDIAAAEGTSRFVRMSLPDVLAGVREAAALMGHDVDDAAARQGGGESFPHEPIEEPNAQTPLVLPSLAEVDLPVSGEARGAILGVARGDLRPDQLYRATVTGAVLHCAWALDQLRAAGLGVASMELVAESLPRGFARLLATVSGVLVRVHAETHLAAIGAALAAARLDARPSTAPWIPPDPARAASWQPVMERFRIEVRKRYRRPAKRTRRDPPTGYVQRLLSADW